MGRPKNELMANANHWLGEAKKNGLNKLGIGAIFIFFNQDGDGSAVATANVSKEKIKRELQTILKKIGERVIISPFDN